MTKLFIFDRDDTLVDHSVFEDRGTYHLLNEKALLNIMKDIHDDPGSYWAIASSGSLDDTVDPAWKLLSRYVDEHNKPVFPKKPLYPQMNRNPVNLANYVSKINNLSFSPPGKNGLRTAHPLESENLRLYQDAFITILSAKSYREEEDILIYENEKTGQSFAITRHSTAQIIIGLTHYWINLFQLASEFTFSNLSQGDNKLFLVLKALDMARLKISLEATEGLKQWGIEALEAPEAYTEIEASQVIFCDDKQGCVDLIRNSGFTAIRADNLSVTEHHNAEEKKRALRENRQAVNLEALDGPFNTYLIALKKHTDPHPKINDQYIANLIDKWHSDNLKNKPGMRTASAKSFISRCEKLDEDLDFISSDYLFLLKECLNEARETAKKSLLSHSIFKAVRKTNIENQAQLLCDRIDQIIHDRGSVQQNSHPIFING